MHIANYATILLILFALVISPGRASAEELKLGGTGSGLGILRKLGEIYMKQHPGVQVKVIPSLGSSGGIRAVGDRAIDIAISSRPLAAEESGLASFRLGTTPLVFATHPGVKISDVTSTQLEQIYAGVMTEWPDGSRLRPVLRPEKETDTRLIREISPAMNRAMTAANVRPGMLLALNDHDNLRMLEKTPGSIGSITLAMLKSEGSALNVLRFNGQEPGIKGISTGKYPLKREFYLVTRGDAKAEVTGFMAFVRTPQAKRLLEKLQCLPGN